MKRTALFLAILCGVAVGQNLPDAPSHQFWERRERILFTVGGGLVVIDSITTQHMIQAHGARELNPVARPLVNLGWRGQIVASSIGFGGAVGLSLLFHATGHHKLERIVPMVLLGAEAIAVTNNLVRDAHGWR
jgi:hypothetical protein